MNVLTFCKNKKFRDLLLISISIIFNIIGIKGINNYLTSRNIKSFQQLKQTCDHCNILLIDIDTLRADELPCYGYFRNTTPNLCSFAKNSVIFNNNYSTYHWTLPSIFSTITSLYPTFHRIQTAYTDVLPQNKITLAKTLYNQGYTTIYVGRSDNTSSLTKENGGLSGYSIITNDPIEKVITNLSKSSKPWFVHYYIEDLHLPYLIPNNVSPIENLVSPKGFPKTADEFNPILNTYLKNHYSEVFQKKAIEKYSSIIFAPNKPENIDMVDLFYNLYMQQYNEQEKEKYLIDVYKPVYNAYMATFNQNKPSDVAYIRMMYDTIINQIDKRITPVLNMLDSKQFSKNTVTMVTSDHGEAFGKYGTFGHDGNIHTESFHTPFIIRAPNLGNKPVNQTTSNIDIFPTLMELVGIKTPIGLQGQSVLTYINNTKDKSTRFVFSESSYGEIVIQDKQWLYSQSKFASVNQNITLYNKSSDPEEKNNIANQYPELVQSLSIQANILRSYDKIFSEEKTTPNPNAVKISPLKLIRLKKEGYF